MSEFFKLVHLLYVEIFVKVRQRRKVIHLESINEIGLVDGRRKVCMADLDKNICC